LLLVAGRTQAENIGKMKCAFFLPLLLLSCSAPGQLMQHDNGYKKKIQIRLLNEKVIYHEWGFDLRVSITNKTDTTFLIYGLKDVEDGWWNGRSTYMKPNITMGSAIFIVNDDRKQLNLKLVNELLDKYESHYTPVPRDSIESRAYKNKMVIPAKSSVECVIPIIPKIKAGGVKDKLPKGEFTLSFLYFCGYNILNVLSKERIKEDEEKYKAMIYQGYVESNAVKLIVE